MMHVCNNIQRYMRPIDAEAFRKEAASQRSYILIRRPNTAARKYIGQHGFFPKPADCKFKIAQQDFYHIRLGKWLTVGGLVVNPTLDEFEKAFTSKKSYSHALKAWQQHGNVVSDISTLGAGSKRHFHFVSDVKQYLGNNDPRSSFYGCLMLSRIADSHTTTFLHSDYDLYAIIPTSNPKTLERLLSELNDKPQYPEVNFFDYQNRLNRAMGVPMIQHAPQELAGQHLDDQVFVFMPDSATIFMLPNQLEIRDFYRNMLGGRQLVNY